MTPALSEEKYLKFKKINKMGTMKYFPRTRTNVKISTISNKLKCTLTFAKGFLVSIKIIQLSFDNGLLGTS